MTKRSRSMKKRGLPLGMTLAVITALSAGLALAAGSHGASPAVYSTRTLVAEAEADLAAGHPGRAILQYDRAQLMLPRSPAIAAGLARARTVASIAAPSSTLGERTLRLASSDVWAWLGMSGLVLAGIGLVGMAWDRFRRGWFILGVAAAGFASLGFMAARADSPPPNRAVVVSAGIVARIAPFAKADESFAAAEGTEVSVERAHDGYYLIATPEGRGWVPSGSVETILPSDAQRS